MLTAAILATLFTSCKKDGQPAETSLEVHENKAMTLIFNEDDLGEFTILSYTNTFINYFVQSNTRESFYLRQAPAYDSSGNYNTRISKVNANTAADASILQLTSTYSYNQAGKLMTINQVSPTTGEKLSYDSLAYAGETEKEMLAAVYRSKKTGPSTFSFYSKDVVVRDGKNNVIARYLLSMADGRETDTVSTTVYTYDDAKAIMYQPGGLYLFDLKDGITWTSVNNPLTAETYYPAGDSVITVTNVYTYDTDKYPSKIQRTRKARYAGVEVYSKQSKYSVKYQNLDQQ